MDKNKRKELQDEFKQIKVYMGVVLVKNNLNGKLFVSAYPNLKNKWMTMKAQLDLGMFGNLQLQKDWKELGEDAFSFEVLEQFDTEKISDVRWEVKKLEKQWREKLQSYDDKGYHKRPANR
ncbi:GIY-YIG nuclease family protein [Paenibacillus protaetiae]|uniref:GIY-YIG nuclease family protein n=1 Tax=Paenibacillus protaetiae TaxID=2509456 RepID=A0A4V0YF53_9BACL|nr:GIY-YIG nuclease family protein [Paenibacillus protaetiae]QAY66511.1 GIY-YIG nuclease family protein [Paenibacillus protaetiae]